MDGSVVEPFFITVFWYKVVIIRRQVCATTRFLHAPLPTVMSCGLLPFAAACCACRCSPLADAVHLLHASAARSSVGGHRGALKNNLRRALWHLFLLKLRGDMRL
jgi:hypothetical protein